MLRKEKLTKIIMAFVGIVLVGIGVAFNAAASLGNDPVGIVYDGIRNAASLSSSQLGTASNIVNVVLVILIFFLERHYVNIGTFIYIIPYGFCVDLGGELYPMIFRMQGLPNQIAGAAVGCILLYVGVALYIVADMGLDPFTGLVMTIRDKVNKQFRIVKICFDLGCISIGFLLGGKLGIITVVTALAAGPTIQFLTEWLQKRIGVILKKERKMMEG